MKKITTVLSVIICLVCLTSGCNNSNNEVKNVNLSEAIKTKSKVTKCTFFESSIANNSLEPLNENGIIKIYMSIEFYYNSLDDENSINYYYSSFEFNSWENAKKYYKSDDMKKMIELGYDLELSEENIDTYNTGEIHGSLWEKENTLVRTQISEQKELNYECETEENKN